MEIFVYIGVVLLCGALGTWDLRNLKWGIERRFGEVDRKAWDCVLGIYFVIYFTTFVYVIPSLIFPSAFRVGAFFYEIGYALFVVWPVGMSSPCYDYLTLSREKAPKLWKFPVVTLGVLTYSLWNATGPLKDNQGVAFVLLISNLEFAMRIFLRRQYVKIKERRNGF